MNIENMSCVHAEFLNASPGSKVIGLNVGSNMNFKQGRERWPNSRTQRSEGRGFDTC